MLALESTLLPGGLGSPQPPDLLDGGGGAPQIFESLTGGGGPDGGGGIPCRQFWGLD